MEFRLDIYTEDVQWITKTLLTIENLRHISVYVRFAFTEPIAETTYREWRDLDRQLVELWTSRSILPEIKFLYREEHVRPILFPELTTVGAFDHRQTAA
jgi:hypothetical protein